ncbi:MAG: nucleotidyl transferase AbiEii/AbiGii toxin family protein [bacterium]
MFEKVISKATKSNMELLRLLCKDYYLVGETGVALQLGHRQSLDLDFFTPMDIDTNLCIERLIEKGDFILEKKSPNTVIGIFEGTKVSFFKYPYPLLFSTKDFMGIKVADILDIACMKMDAISSRGSRRDFIDLYVICQQKRHLREILGFFREKYKSVNYNIIHILKSLTYFDDADKEPMPNLLIEIDWAKVKDFFESEVKEIKWGGNSGRQG